MRVSHVEVRLSSADLNDWMAELSPDLKARIVDISESGVHGQIRLLVWNIDFVARPSADWATDTITLEISAHKLVNIPSALVERQLKEALKDGPPGVEVLRQSLRIHVPALLQPLGVTLRVKELRCQVGYLVLVLEQCRFPMPAIGSTEAFGSVPIGAPHVRSATVPHDVREASRVAGASSTDPTSSVREESPMQRTPSTSSSSTSLQSTRSTSQDVPGITAEAKLPDAQMTP